MRARVLMAFLLVVAVGVLCLRVMAWGPVLRKLIYVSEPLSGDRISPAVWGMPRAESVWISSIDGTRIHGWWVPAEPPGEPSCGVLLHFHGNAGNISSRAGLARWLSGLGLDVLIFDYRGYGASEGSPDELGLYLDGEAAYDFVVHEKGIPPDRIVLMGHSLGNAVLSEIATDRPAAGIVLVAPFTSLPAAARVHLLGIPSWLFDWEKERFDMVEEAHRLEVPALVAVGGADRLIPRAEALGLYRALAGPKRWVEIASAGHNDIFAEPDFQDAMVRFLRSRVRCPGRAS